MFDEPGVWVVPPDGDLELYVALPERSFPNGIALSPDQTVLYVATSQGIARIDRGDRSISILAAAELNRTAGLDGLYAIDGALIAVQPDPGAVIRFDLETGGTGISAITTLLGPPDLPRPDHRRDCRRRAAFHRERAVRPRHRRWIIAAAIGAG
jgi:DNA-binding beta-propeller fold protein YncE